METNTYTPEEFQNVDINAWRNGYKWSIPECLQLEREYDLLKLSVPEMAIKHKRTINAIMCKLQAEGLDTYNNLYNKTYGQDHIDEQINKLNNLHSTDDDEDDDEDDEDYVTHIDANDNMDNGSKQAYIFHQVQRIQKHVTNLLSYFTNINVNEESEMVCA